MAFTNKIALVTGAGSGIGRAVAIALARESATVVLAGRTLDKLEAVAAEIAAAGGTAVARAADVAVRAENEALVDWTVARFGRLDLTFNNAGGHGDFTPLHEIAVDEAEWVIDLNFKAVFYGVRAQTAAMLRTGGGAIVNTASIFGLKGVAGISHYVAAKFAVVGLTKSAALDYVRSGIRINAICPGATETPNLLRVTGGDAHALDHLVPMGRLGQPAEMAEAVVWLLSDKAAYVTGAVLSVDGGMAAG